MSRITDMRQERKDHREVRRMLKSDNFNLE
jgi:hypothetical protein